MAGTTGKSLLAIALCAMVLPHAGWADGPSRQKITETIQIDAPPAKVWATIADFHDMSWLPGVAMTTGEGGNEPDVAKRQLTLDGGATIDESLDKYDPGAMSYSYRIDKVDVKVLPVNNYSSTIAVLPAEGGKSTVDWRGAFYRGDPNNDPPPELNDEAALKAVGKVYRSGLKSLKKKGRGGQVTGMRVTACLVCLGFFPAVLRPAGPTPSSPVDPVTRSACSISDRYPEGIETRADGDSVYVVNWFSNELWAIDAETLAVTGKTPAGDGPVRSELFCTRRFSR